MRANGDTDVLSVEEEMALKKLLSSLELLEPIDIPEPEDCLRRLKSEVIVSEQTCKPSAWEIFFQNFRLKTWMLGGVVCILVLIGVGRREFLSRDRLYVKGNLRGHSGVEVGLLVGVQKDNGLLQVGDGDLCPKRAKLVFRYAMAKNATPGFVYLLRWYRHVDILFPSANTEPSFSLPGRSYDIQKGKTYALDREEGALSFLLLKSETPLKRIELKTIQQQKSLGRLKRLIRYWRQHRKNVTFDLVTLKVGASG